MRPFLSAAERGFHLAAKLKWLGSRSLLDSYPRIARGWESLAKSGARHDPMQFWRIAELLELLSESQPTTIAEAGSGLSTIVFADYCARTGAKLASLEEHPAWLAITRSALNAAGLESNIVKHSDVLYEKEGNRFATPLPRMEFLYIDGPTTSQNGRKVANTDAALLIKSGHKPKMIAVDGRIGAVDTIRSAAPEYRFSPGTIYELKNRRTGIPYRIHSVFRLA